MESRGAFANLKIVRIRWFSIASSICLLYSSKASSSFVFVGDFGTTSLACSLSFFPVTFQITLDAISL